MTPAAIAADIRLAARASAQAIAARQAERLQQLLQAARTTPFYQRILAELDRTHPPGCIPLNALPVLTKPELMCNFADHVADPQLTLAGLSAFCADPQRIGQAYLGKYWVWESSGSTGQSALFVQDEQAMAVYDALEAGRRDSPRPWARLWDPLYLAERFALVGAIGGHFASQVSVQRLRLAQPWLTARWRSFSILQPAKTLVAELNDFAPTILATYPTAAVLLADEVRRGHLRCRPQEIWTGGETLTPAMRGHIEQSFGCALRNSYGASEFLPIAWECGHGQLHVNADWVLLEPVDAQYRPVPPGQTSHTTLLTNLANHLQPLIRFDLGDRITVASQPCRCGSALPVVQVQGRRDDALIVPGIEGQPVTLLPLALSTVLEDQAGLFDFQLRQLPQRGGGTWRLLLGPTAAATPAQREHYRRLLCEFATAQGAMPLHISTQAVAALPLGRSGKLKRVVAG